MSKVKLVREVDGLQHEWKEKDAEKVKKIEEAGCIVYRFTTKDVREDVEGITRFVKEVTCRNIKKSFEEVEEGRTPS
ncbi:MAG: DUF559 domain-containing protein [Nitrososphaerota archaeon]